MSYKGKNEAVWNGHMSIKLEYDRSAHWPDRNLRWSRLLNQPGLEIGMPTKFGRNWSYS